MKKERITDALSHVWLLGTLIKIKRSTLASALYEFLYLFLWSILPFGLGGLVLYVTSENSGKNLFELVLNTFRNGELLVFTISMLAPVLYMTQHDPDGADRFPHKLPISTVGTLVIVTCAALFAVLKAASVKDFPFVFELSIGLTVLALVFRYIAIVYHRYRLHPPTEMEMREQQVNFVEDFRHHIDKDLGANQKSFVTQFKNHLGEAP